MTETVERFAVLIVDFANMFYGKKQDMLVHHPRNQNGSFQKHQILTDPNPNFQLGGEYADQRTDASFLQTSLGKVLLGKLDIELTERCNCNCIHCYINQPENHEISKSHELATEKIKALLQEAADLGCLRVRFTGGEPLLREDFPDIYEYTRRLGIKVQLFTNATLITDQMAALFKRIPPLEKIEISVYGMSKRSYEAVTRTPGSFQAAMRGIALLTKNKIPFLVKSALLPPNKYELQQFEQWSNDLPWVTRAPQVAVFYDCRCRRDSVDKNRRIKRLRLSPGKGLGILMRHRQQYDAELASYCSKFMFPRGDRLLSCGAGVRQACIDAYGNVQPCLLLRHPETTYSLIAGKGYRGVPFNVTHSRSRPPSLTDALLHFFPLLRKKKTTNPAYLARCARCYLHGLCDQCPANAWMENGTLDTPVEFMCEVTHRQAIIFGLLKKGEKAWLITDWEQRQKKLAKYFSDSRKTHVSRHDERLFQSC